MYMGYISNDGKNQNNPEAIGEKKKEREPTPEEIAEGEQRATEWNEALGVEPAEQTDFSESMADVVPFQGDTETATTETEADEETATGESTKITPFPGVTEATIAGATAGTALDAVATIGETPNAEEDAKEEETEETEEEEGEEEAEERANQTQAETANADNENQRTVATITEETAKQQIAANDVDVSNLVQNVAGVLPGGEETIISDAATASTNIAQAESAANGLATKVAAGESDGSVEGENILNAAMVSAANMSVTTEKAATDVVNEHPDAEASITDAKNAIEQTESVKESLARAAEQVQNPELVPKMRAGVQDIEAELAHSQDLLAEATDAMAKETEEETEEEESEDAVAIQAQGQQNEGAEMEDIGYAPGQMNADAFKRLTEEREEKQKAAAEATTVKAEQATDENISYRRAIYG